MLSDSGTFSEESSILHFKPSSIRQTHEGDKAMEKAVRDDSPSLKVYYLFLKVRGIRSSKPSKVCKDYNLPNVSEKILRIILSFYRFEKEIYGGQGYENTIRFITMLRR